jgi:hypothetical protein
VLFGGCPPQIKLRWIIVISSCVVHLEMSVTWSFLMPPTINFFVALDHFDSTISLISGHVWYSRKNPRGENKQGCYSAHDSYCDVQAKSEVCSGFAPSEVRIPREYNCCCHKHPAFNQSADQAPWCGRKGSRNTAALESCCPQKRVQSSETSDHQTVKIVRCV